jgi:hypothetical protein
MMKIILTALITSFLFSMAAPYWYYGEIEDKVTTEIFEYHHKEFARFNNLFIISRFDEKYSDSCMMAYYAENVVLHKKYRKGASMRK